jgi:hypothetical protein
MPDPYVATRENGQAFDGLTAATGLFRPVTNVGPTQLQFRLNSVSFHTEGSAVAFALYKRDPATLTNKVLILADTNTDFDIEAGEIVLPTKSDGRPWDLILETGNMDGDVGHFTVDYDLETTEG